MSLPVVTGKVTEPFAIGGKFRQHTKIVAGPSVYETGGVLLNVKDFGDSWFLNIFPAVSTDGTHIAYFYPESGDTAAVKEMRMFITVAVSGAEAANGADLDALEFVVVAQMFG